MASANCEILLMSHRDGAHSLDQLVESMLAKKHLKTYTQLPQGKSSIKSPEMAGAPSAC